MEKTKNRPLFGINVDISLHGELEKEGGHIEIPDDLDGIFFKCREMIFEAFSKANPHMALIKDGHGVTRIVSKDV